MIKNFLKSHSIHKKIAPFFDVIMLLRPTLFFGVWVMICIGMYIGSLINDNLQMNITIYDPFSFILFIGISLVCGSIFILNQIDDLEVDKVNNNVTIIDEYISREKAILISNIICFSGFLLILFVDFVVIFPILLIYLIWGRLYVDQKLNLKSGPWIGFLFYVLLGYLLILSGVIYNRYNSGIMDILIQSSYYVIPFILAYSAIALMINISNKDGDESVGRQTIAVLFGINTTSILAFFLCLLSFFMGLYLSEPLSSVSSLSALPFFIFLIFRGKTKDILRSIRYSIFLLNFYVLTIYPLLFFPVIISYYLSKYYYWHRFSIHYPTLLVEND